MTETVTKKWMLFFPRCECEKPIVYHLVKDHNLIVNIFRARVTPEEEGYLVLDVTGTEQEIEQGMAFVKTFNVTINETGKGLTWNPGLCTHCGHCLAHCPTDALHVIDPKTREIGFDEEKCIDCLACIPVCVYNACSTPF